MFFVGLYEQTIDGKNRLAIPHPIRSKMNADTDGRGFYVLPGQEPGTLAIYAEKYFEDRVRSLVPAEEDLSEQGHAWRRFEFSQAALLDADSQGRILIPDRLLKRTGIGSKVTLIGVQDHLEVWEREAYDRFQDGQWSGFVENRQKAVAEFRELKSRQAAQKSPAGEGSGG